MAHRALHTHPALPRELTVLALVVVQGENRWVAICSWRLRSAIGAASDLLHSNVALLPRTSRGSGWRIRVFAGDALPLLAHALWTGRARGQSALVHTGGGRTDGLLLYRLLRYPSVNAQ